MRMNEKFQVCNRCPGRRSRSLCVPSVHAQATPSNPCKTTYKKHKAKKDEIPCDDVRKMLADQQAQIDALKQQLANQQAPTMPPPPPETDPIATPLAQKAQSTADAAQVSASSAVTTAQAADVKATDANARRLTSCMTRCTRQARCTTRASR